MNLSRIINSEASAVDCDGTRVNARGVLHVSGYLKTGMFIQVHPSQVCLFVPASFRVKQQVLLPSAVPVPFTIKLKKTSNMIFEGELLGTLVFLFRPPPPRLEWIYQEGDVYGAAANGAASSATAAGGAPEARN